MPPRQLARRRNFKCLLTGGSKLAYRKRPLTGRFLSVRKQKTDLLGHRLRPETVSQNGTTFECRRRWPPLIRRIQSRGGRPRRRCRDSCRDAETLQTRGIWPACLSRVLIASVLTKSLRTGNPLALANSVIVATRLPAKGSVLGPPPARNATRRHPTRNSPDRPQFFMNGPEIPKESASTPFVRASGRPVNRFSREETKVHSTN